VWRRSPDHDDRAADHLDDHLDNDGRSDHNNDDYVGRHHLIDNHV
jgi:hypothetical protein